MVKGKKSQAWYLDFMVGLLIFVMVIIIYYQYYGGLTDESEAELQELIIDSKSISSSFISAGYPRDWTNDTVEILGLTEGNYRINTTKLERMKNMTYKQTKDLLKTRFDFYFYLQDENGNVTDYAGTNSTDPSFLVQSTRFVICGSSVCKMVVHLWKE